MSYADVLHIADEFLESTDAAVRANAVRSLGGIHARGALERLTVAAVNDRDAAVRERALHTFASLEPAMLAWAGDELGRRLRDRSASRRQRAYSVLCAMRRTRTAIPLPPVPFLHRCRLAAWHDPDRSLAASSARIGALLGTTLMVVLAAAVATGIGLVLVFGPHTIAEFTAHAVVGAAVILLTVVLAFRSSRPLGAHYFRGAAGVVELVRSLIAVLLVESGFIVWAAGNQVVPAPAGALAAWFAVTVLTTHAASLVVRSSSFAGPWRSPLLVAAAAAVGLVAGTLMIHVWMLSPWHLEQAILGAGITNLERLSLSAWAITPLLATAVAVAGATLDELRDNPDLDRAEGGPAASARPPWRSVLAIPVALVLLAALVGGVRTRSLVRPAGLAPDGPRALEVPPGVRLALSEYAVEATVTVVDDASVLAFVPMLATRAASVTTGDADPHMASRSAGVGLSPGTHRLRFNDAPARLVSAWPLLAAGLMPERPANTGVGTAATVEINRDFTAAARYRGRIQALAGMRTDAFIGRVPGMAGAGPDLADLVAARASGGTFADTAAAVVGLMHLAENLMSRLPRLPEGRDEERVARLDLGLRQSAAWLSTIESDSPDAAGTRTALREAEYLASRVAPVLLRVLDFDVIDVRADDVATNRRLLPHVPGYAGVRMRLFWPSLWSGACRTLTEGRTRTGASADAACSLAERTSP